MDAETGNETVKSSGVNRFAIVIALVLLALTSFLFYTYFRIKNTPPKTTIAPTTPTLAEVPKEAVVYTNDKYLYSYDCPANTIQAISETKGDGIEAPLAHETCSEPGNDKKIVNIYVWSSKATEITYPKGVFVKEFLTKSGNERVFVSSTDKTFFDQVVGSFKFTE